VTAAPRPGCWARSATRYTSPHVASRQARALSQLPGQRRKPHPKLRPATNRFRDRSMMLYLTGNLHSTNSRPGRRQESHAVGGYQCCKPAVLGPHPNWERFSQDIESTTNAAPFPVLIRPSQHLSHRPCFPNVMTDVQPYRCFSSYPGLGPSNSVGFQVFLTVPLLFSAACGSMVYHNIGLPFHIHSLTHVTSITSSSRYGHS
jgi:hypothetical protein